MKWTKLLLFCSFVGLVLAVLAWLAYRPTGEDGPTTASQPTTALTVPVIRLGLMPERDVFAVRREYQELSVYLQKRTGYGIDLATSNSYRNVLRDFEESRIDAAFLGSLVATLALDRTGAQVIARTEQTSGISTYTGVIFVPENSSIKELCDLKGKRLAGVRTTMSAALYPVYECKLNHQDEKNPDHWQMVWAGTHESVIDEVLSGRADAGAIKNLRLDAYERLHPEQKFRRLAVSAPVPDNALLVSKAMNPEVAAKLRGALLAMHKDDEGQRVLKTLGLKQYVPCGAEDFSAIYDMVEALGPHWVRTGVDGPPPNRPTTRPAGAGNG